MQPQRQNGFGEQEAGTAAESKPQPRPARRGRVIDFRRQAADRSLQQPAAPVAAPETTRRVVVTILFTDIIGSTVRAVELGDHRWLQLRRRHDDLAREQVVRFGGRVLQNTGDGLVAVFDVPADAVRAATVIQREIRELGLELRAGIHTGECELQDGELAGIVFHIGARVAAKAGAGEVLVSRTVRDLVLGSQLAFVERGAHGLKGLPGAWELYAAEP